MSARIGTSLLASLVCLVGLANAARAGVTVDLYFVDMTLPTSITVVPHDPGPGCRFRGYDGNSVTTGRCMDVMLYTTDDLVGFSVPLT